MIFRCSIINPDESKGSAGEDQFFLVSECASSSKCDKYHRHDIVTDIRATKNDDLRSGILAWQIEIPHFLVNFPCFCHLNVHLNS